MKKWMFVFLIYFVVNFYGFSQIETKDYYSIKECNENFELLIITCDVPDVNIYLNGEYQGKSNLIIENLFPNLYEITVEKKGFKTQNEIIKVKRGYIIEYYFEMEKLDSEAEETKHEDKTEKEFIEKSEDQSNLMTEEIQE